MPFISIYFVLFVLLLNFIYYCTPVKYRRIILLGGSILYVAMCSGIAAWMMIAAAAVSFLYGLWKPARKGTVIVVLILLLPMLCVRVFSDFMGAVGLSFYTLSLISYVIDIYRGELEPEKNFGRYLLFVTFFPKIVQGPITRYESFSTSLYQDHFFDYREFTFGWQRILWGYFLKFVVADKAGIMVDTVYGNYRELQGVYIAVAAILYCIQIYADFNGCIQIVTGVAETFGIELPINFRQPYFAGSIREYWRRWHISLSTWLRDYVYIPLGGNRKGKVRKYINIMLVFAVSGLWHGNNITFWIWGLIHGLYQVLESFWQDTGRWYRKVITFMQLTFAFILFRAESLQHFAGLVKGLFATFNPEAVFDGDAYYRMGLSRLQTLPLIFGIILMFAVDYLHERNIRIRDYIAGKPLLLRWSIYLLAVLFVVIFGTYGPAYAANQFIYGQF